MLKILVRIVDDIKEKLTDYQYKTIMDNLMVLNNNTDEELEELSEQISFLNIYIPTIDDEELKKIFVRRLDILRCLFSERC
jgi:hypothetical protein